MVPKNETPAAPARADRENDVRFGQRPDLTAEALGPQLSDNHDDDGLGHCHCREWLVIYQADRRQRANGRWAIVVTVDGEVMAWAAHSPAQGTALHCVLLYGGRHHPISGPYGSLPDFLRAVRETIIEDLAAPRIVLWHEGAP